MRFNNGIKKKLNKLYVGVEGMKKFLGIKNIYVIISYIMLLGVLPVTLIFSGLIGKKLENHIEHTMKDSAKLCAEIIERQYESDMLMLEGLAVRMATSFEDDPELAMERLVSTAERYNMKRIAFAFSDGSALTTDDAEMNLTGVDNFERSIKGESFLSVVIPDVADGEMINVYSLPVYKNGTNEILGVMFAVYGSETFEDLLAASFFDGNGFTYIIDINGNIVIDSKHEHALHTMKNIFQYVGQYDTKAVVDLMDSLRNNGSGFFEITRNRQEDLYTYYIKLGISDWYVLSVVPENVAEETRTAVMASVMVYCLLVSVIALAVVLSIRRAMRDKNKLLKEALYVDPITGGRSYEKFRIDCKKRLKEHKEKKAVFVFLDIDNFNLVATLYGHEESLDTIRRVYAMIDNCVGSRGIIGRNSSDQFCLMYFYNEHEEFEKSIQNFVKTLHDNAKFANMLRPSMGIYMVEDWEEGIHDMLNKARTAHETIKQNENTIIAYYDAGFRDKKYQNKHMAVEMEEALKKHEFVPYLQPKYDAVSATICGAEALIRWINSEGKIVPPGMFIPLAENNGFVRSLDREMFAMVCQLQKSLLDSGMKPVPISVNVSRQLLYDKTFADDYCEYVQKVGIPADLVELEITESAFFEDINLFRNTLEKLRSFGFRILMDDFGTGYSSLMMLHTVPIDVMKLDKSFIDDYADEKGSSIIQCVLNLAKQLNIPVVAEGVETEEQYVYLKNSGCDVIQGYYFSKPVPKDEFLQKIAV